MADQEISLKWNGYQNNILSNVKELFKDEGLSDVTLVSEGQSFKAHKVILSANSSVFRSIFQQNPHKDPIIVLHDINTDSLRTLLRFMYNGEVNVTEEFLPILLKTAEVLRICGLSTGADSGRDDEKTATSTQSVGKKRKKSEQEDNNNKIHKKPSPCLTKFDTTVCITNSDPTKNSNIVPKVEPVDSPLTDYSGENTNDADIAVLDDRIEKKYSISPETLQSKSVCTTASTDCGIRKWINEVSSTQPCLNVVNEKNVEQEEDKEIEIDKEVETVLQSGTIVESLSITTGNLSFVSNEAQIVKDKTNTCYANPSFPCPFCPRVYNSWGYRRRHVKSRHMTNRLSCKWCVSILPSTGAWYSHATRSHGVPHEEARNSLVVMVEAHAVLTLNEPSVAQLLGQVGISDSNSASANEKTN